MAPLEDFDPDRDLLLELTLEAPRALVWRCWTEADLMKQWFAPKPFTTPEAEVDLRPGGLCRTVMACPDGMRITNMWTYVAIEPGTRTISANIGPLCGGMLKSSVMTVDLQFADAPGGGTQYRAHVRHWTTADRDAHAAMGFTEGWTQCARQLDALAGTLSIPA